MLLDLWNECDRLELCHLLKVTCAAVHRSFQSIEAMKSSVNLRFKGPLTRPHSKFWLYAGSCYMPSKECSTEQFFKLVH